MIWFALFYSLVVLAEDPIHCSLKFYNLKSHQEVETLQMVFKQLAIDHQVTVQKKNDENGVFLEFHFLVESIDQIKSLNQNIPHQTDGSMLYQEFKPEYRSQFLALNLESKLQKEVQFQVTQGSELFVKFDMNKEDKISKKLIQADGRVFLKIPPNFSDSWLYVRTSLKNLNRYVRINVDDGQVQKITKMEYQKRSKLEIS